MTQPTFIDRPPESAANLLNGPAAYRNGTTTPATPELLYLVESAMERHAKRTAIESSNSSLTYRELTARSNRLAHWLCAQGVGPDAPVGVRLEKSPEALIAILAVLRAGGAYVPLDPHYPAERLANMLEDAAPRLVLDADALAGDFSGFPIEPPQSLADDDHLGYILFTSGSTGRPKGVAMRRGPLRRLIDWQVRNSTAGPSDSTLQFASLSFDVSFQEIFSTWATGGTLMLATEAERRDPAALLRLIESKNIRRVFVPFVMLQHLCEATPPAPPCQGGERGRRQRVCEKSSQPVNSCRSRRPCADSSRNCRTAHYTIITDRQRPTSSPLTR